MVPMEVSALKHDIDNHTEDGQRDALLNDFQLYQVEWTAILNEPKAVGGNLTAVFEEGYHPRESDDADEWPMTADTILLQFQMPIPSQRHEDVA